MPRNKLSTREPTPRGVSAGVPTSAFANSQLDLFQTFLANTGQQLDMLSNAVDFWDSVPRYAVSRRAMHSLRKTDGGLDPISLPFKYHGRAFSAEIQATKVQSSSGAWVAYYPSAREELIEHALRRIAAQASAGFYDAKSTTSGVQFSLSGLRRELLNRGHAVRYEHLVEGLEILSGATIRIVADDGEGQGSFVKSPYLTALTRVTRPQYDANRDVRWTARFHPLVTQCIERVTYRQYNYERWMHCDTQIARWLVSQLVLKYTQASIGNTFEMRYSTIRRDSALLDHYARPRDGIAALGQAWEELMKGGALESVDKTVERGAHGETKDVVYVIRPSHKFSAEQRAANRRQADARSQRVAAPAQIGAT